MKSNITAILNRVLIGMLLASVAGNAVSQTRRAALTPEEEQTIQQRIDRAGEASRAGRHGQAARDLAELVDGRLAERMDAQTRHRVTSLTGSFFGLAGDAANGIKYVTLASNMSQAISRDWAYRVSMHFKLNDTAAATSSTVQLATKWPDSIREVDEVVISTLVDRADDDDTNQKRFIELVEALSFTDWPRDKFYGASYWKQLVHHHLESKNLKRAVEVSARILSPRTLIRMRADSRFGDVVRAAPRTFDIEHAIEYQVEYAQRRVKGNTRLMSSRGQLVNALMDAGRFNEALTAATDTLQLHQVNRSYFEDSKDGLSWMREYRASAMLALGMPDAIQQMKEAANTPESGHPNVSQALNLGAMQCRAGNLQGLDEAVGQARKQPASLFGSMQLAAHELCRAILAGDQKGVSTQLAYMNKNRDVAPTTYFTALLRANEMDAAAEWLIVMLRSQDDRADGLFEVQRFKPRQLPPMTRIRLERLDRTIMRADVASAISAVGNIQTYELYPH